MHRGLIYTGLACLAWVGLSGLMLARAPEDSPTVRVAAVQHGFTAPGHMEEETQAVRLAVLTEQTHHAAEQGARLVVWPELGLGFDPQVEHTAQLQRVAVETDTYILIGYGVKDDPQGWRNEAVMLTPEGDFLDIYGKNYASVPTEPRIVSSGVYPIHETDIGRLGTIICNDVNFPQTTRSLARKGAQLITVPTYESGAPGLGWKQRTQVVLRAVQNRVAVIKADNAGISMIIDPYGHILAHAEKAPNEAFALVADVPLGDGDSMYNRFGDWAGWLILAGVVIFSVATNKKE